MLKKKFFCPVNGWNCPYCQDDEGTCHLVDEGKDPIGECDDAAAIWGPDEDYFVWADENGNIYEVWELLEMGYHFVDGEPVKPPLG